MAVGDALAEIRRRSGLSVREVARRMELHHSAIVRAEAGTKRLEDDEVATLLGHLGATAAERQSIMAMLRDTDRSAWSAMGHSMPVQLSTLVRYEKDARRIIEVSSALVPGLLQTENYIRAIMSMGDVPADEIDDRVTYRLGRQAVLRRTTPPALEAIIDEAVLLRHIGGHAVMAEQLRELESIAHDASVTVRVLPLEAGAHRGMIGGFTVLESLDTAPVVHLEHLDSGTFVHKRPDTKTFLDALDSLRLIALSPEASTELIATHADIHAREASRS
ncbi:helix-turn-helix domain-containing protein [Actinoalloteichus hymeniacidonis]|uniref:DNA binding protein with helix-turn-helix domain n=1 Tax=Actinoalloteichus hymeniacidonis TaxID=340345 RepID=A0AAC9HKM6_9PSEU|nr:helix-turn-helix transcriptional regulator [Actinoalloteichus hymeniacidonis]AOS61043.1 DNA binding protein with helix-turn-helix domain [Actinoalloteichus hymeniacidonis]MBB5910957.1 transcriptional regulator with XRE-family HTH domain [Actinoalloteichus hymeniacidonis]